jgi:hypothetical protein
MVKLLYSLGLAAMILAGLLFIISGIQWLHGTSRDNSAESIYDKLRIPGFVTLKEVNMIFPLVEKATEFSQYLNPPKPPEAVAVSTPKTQPQPVYISQNITAIFRLLSTSYYISSPEKSLALISEPGTGEHWVKNGDHIGNFVLEKVENGSIVYREGSQLHEMNISIPQPAQLAQTKTESPNVTGQIIGIGSNDQANAVSGSAGQSLLAGKDSPLQGDINDNRKNIAPSIKLVYASQSKENQE